LCASPGGNNAVYQWVGPGLCDSVTSGNTSASGVYFGPGLITSTDANGCTYQELYCIVVSLNTAAATAATCGLGFGLANGTVRLVDVSNFSGSGSYTFDAIPVLQIVKWCAIDVIV
jgi:hypothetical protein